MKYAKHVLMCAPMIIVAAVLLAAGSGIAILIPLAGCMLMMVLMMNAMGEGGGHGSQGSGR